MDEHNLAKGTFNWWVKTNCLETAQGVEDIMDSKDCGSQIGNGDSDSVFVYIYRKSNQTKE